MVVEAAKRSGSLITAQLALDQNREVFAVPGRIDSFKSVGTHTILQQGAKLVYSIRDILEELPSHESPGGSADHFLQKENDESADLEENEKMILDLLDTYPVHIDSVVRQSGLPVRQVSETLLLLEMNGLIEALPGKQFRRLAYSK